MLVDTSRTKTRSMFSMHGPSVSVPTSASASAPASASPPPSASASPAPSHMQFPAAQRPPVLPSATQRLVHVDSVQPPLLESSSEQPGRIETARSAKLPRRTRRTPVSRMVPSNTGDGSIREADRPRGESPELPAARPGKLGPHRHPHRIDADRTAAILRPASGRTGAKGGTTMQPNRRTDFACVPARLAVSFLFALLGMPACTSGAADDDEAGADVGDAIDAEHVSDGRDRPVEEEVSTPPNPIAPERYDCRAHDEPPPDRISPIAWDCLLDPTCRERFIVGHRGAGGDFGVVAPRTRWPPSGPRSSWPRTTWRPIHG